MKMKITGGERVEQLNLDKFADGLYFVKLSSENEVIFVDKVVKLH